MPAIGTISVNDAKGTPVAHAFTPVTTDGQLAKWANRTAATTPQGFELLNVELRAPVGKDAAYRLLASGYFPTEVTVNGVTSVDRSNSWKLDCNFSSKSTSQERLDEIKLISGILDHATVKSMVQNLEPAY